MKRYFVLFSNAEAFLRIQYVCQDVKTNNSNTNIVIGNFIGKELIISLLKKNKAEVTLSKLKQLSLKYDEFLIVNFKNKPSLNVDFLEFFETIENKDYKYLEAKIASVNQDRLKIVMESLLKDISSDVAKRDLTFEIKIAKEKKEILDYFKSVLEFIKLEDSLDNKTIYNMLFVLYYLNNTEAFTSKKIFYSKNHLSLDEYLNDYSKILSKLILLYEKGIISYPFDEETEIIKEKEILQEEKILVEYLLENPSSISIYEKNSINIWDIAFIYHIENEENENDSFVKAMKYCEEKNILQFKEGKLFMTKNGERIYNSILERDLEKYLLKGF